MIDVTDSSAVYYYHYDGSGSVVALSDSYGSSRQSYEYSAYGQVRAEDLDFTANPYMYTGRRFDYETGLYYYRARYYNPYIGRFLQTDPIGYDAGMNLYRYSMNNPLNMTDPSGCDPSDSTDSDDKQYWEKAGYKSLEACIGDELFLCGGVWNAVGGVVWGAVNTFVKIKLIVTYSNVVGLALGTYCAGEVFGAYVGCSATTRDYYPPEPDEEPEPPEEEYEMYDSCEEWYAADPDWWKKVDHPMYPECK